MNAAEEIRLYRALFDASPMAMAVTAKRCFVMVNPAFEALFDYRASDLLGQSARMIWSDESEFVNAGRDYLGTAATGKTYAAVHRFRRRDGSDFRAIIHVRAIDPRNVERGVVGVVEDLTERIGLEAAMRESEARFRLLLDSTAEGIYGIDTEGRCTFANPSCAALLGYADARELLGRNMHDLVHHSHPDGRPYPIEDCPIYRAYRENTAIHIVDHEVFWRADGSSVPVEYWSHPMLCDGKVVGAAVTFIDVTERRNAEETIRRQNAELAETNRYRSEFLATVTHELKTPLNAVIGFSEMIASGVAAPAETPGFAHEIHTSALGLLERINQILEITRIDAGQFEPINDPAEIGVVLHAAAQPLAARAEERRVRIDFGVAPQAGVRLIDGRMTAKIVTQLLANAIDFSPQGGTVRLRAEAEGTTLRLSVADDGPGIARADQARLFQPFVQVDGGLSRSRGGAGLGLYFVRRLAEALGGGVSIESEPGRGTRFIVHLPAPAAPDAE